MKSRLTSSEVHFTTSQTSSEVYRREPRMSGKAAQNDF